MGQGGPDPPSFETTYNESSEMLHLLSSFPHWPTWYERVYYSSDIEIYFTFVWGPWKALYRQEISTSELEREKLFRFSPIAYAYVGKTE